MPFWPAKKIWGGFCFLISSFSSLFFFTFSVISAMLLFINPGMGNLNPESVWPVSFLIWDLAKLLFTNLNQSFDGFLFLLVAISTTSPFSKAWLKGTIFPLIFASSQWFPISECTAYAKSTTVEPLGKAITSPFGVKAKILSGKKSILKFFQNSDMSFIHLKFSPSFSRSIFSLYAQCAQMPYSASLCICSVFIWTSVIFPSFEKIVVCKDLYPFGFGFAI